MPGSAAGIDAVNATPGSLGPVDSGTGSSGAGVPTGENPLPVITQAHQVTPADARELSTLFFARLRELPEGSAGHQYARNTLIELNMALVRFAARGFRSRTGSASGAGAEMEDVLQAGTIGLIKAIDRFDPDRGVEFSTLALPYITGEIKRHFRDTTWAVRVPRRLQELRIELAKARDDLSATLGRAPTVKETAQHLRLAEEVVIEGLVAANGYSTETLDAPLQAEERPGPGNRTHALSEVTGETDRAMELFEDLHALGPLLKQLPARDRTILYLRFGQELTQAQIGAELGISQMQVSRILTRILTGLRAGMLAA
ncbi:SigB/SigF/SigG family RNA polymerase sigma factor [Streptomyces sp. NPDC058646]|uniref:SigB/SigF/SigG family RNA polymerase sigma factor n=1 Tax=Streptomyces sp. NPDC058646 TaxID=3346574 RepID=UPI00366081AD